MFHSIISSLIFTRKGIIVIIRLMKVVLRRRNRNVEIERSDRKRLSKILETPLLYTLDRNDKELLYKYRNDLVGDSRALIRYLECVEWKDENECIENQIMISKWKEIDYEDTLFLLGPKFEDNQYVREYAVKILNKKLVDNGKLYEILVPLVQSLRYEKLSKLDGKSIGNFLVSRACCDYRICYFLECSLRQAMEETNFRIVHEHFHEVLMKENPVFMDKLSKQFEFLQILRKTRKTMKSLRLRRKARIEHLRKELSCNEELSKMSILPSFVNPDLQNEDKFIPELSSIVKSREYPFMLFSQDTRNQTRHSMIFSGSDQIFQDQLMTLVIKLCVRLLNDNGLDLSLITYQVVATSKSEGFIECIQNRETLQEICSEMTWKKDCLLNWLKKRNEHPEDFNNACDRFIRSCAGYSIITYLFGVGDRHIENLMIVPDGRFFHIDYDYIFGNDPKRFPPQLKLTKNMVEVIRSVENGYDKFLNLCCDSYNVLRKHSNLIFSIFALVRDTTLFSDVHTKAMKYLQTKFREGVSDEEASEKMKLIIEDAQWQVTIRYGSHSSIYRPVARTLRE